MNCFKKMVLFVAAGCLVIATSVAPLLAQAENQAQQSQTQAQPNQTQAQAQQKQPQAKTKAEYDAYLALYNEQDLNKKVELGNKFMTDYPDSEFKPFIYQIQINSYATSGNPTKVVETGEKFLTEFPQADNNAKKFVYQRVMQSYQAQNNFEKTVEYGEKLLAVDPTDLPALLTLSSILPERLPQEDEAKKNQQLDKAMDYAQKAMTQVNALVSGPKPAQVSDQQWAEEKNKLLAAVHSSIGLVHLNKKEYDKATGEYEKSTSLVRNNPIDFYRLGIAYSFQARNIAKELNELVAGLQNQTNPDLSAKEAKEKQFAEMRDKAIDALAKSVALKGVTEQQARSELEKLYKSKNSNSLEGLDNLIAQAANDLKKPVQ
jgi:hypothetical protein